MIVGIALLGDTTRAGWAPIAVAAFFAAVVGAVVVAVSGAVEHQASRETVARPVA